MYNKHSCDAYSGLWRLVTKSQTAPPRPCLLTRKQDGLTCSSLGGRLQSGCMLRGASSRFAAGTRSWVPFSKAQFHLSPYTAVIVEHPCRVSKDKSIQSHIKLLWCVHISLLKSTKMKGWTQPSSPADDKHDCCVQGWCSRSTEQGFQMFCAAFRAWICAGDR